MAGAVVRALHRQRRAQCERLAAVAEWTEFQRLRTAFLALIDAGVPMDEAKRIVGGRRRA
jgi:hypothetical protein